MESHDFFDKLYQMWTRTTHAQDRYWDYQETADGDLDISAVGEGGEKLFVGYTASEPDADFITAMHGCFPDLYRCLNVALDEADRADLDRDSRECRIAELEMEVDALNASITEYEADLQACKAREGL